MEYEKPPVVEVALTFHFKQSDETPAWNEDNGLRFVNGAAGFSKPSYIYQQSIQVLSDIQTGTTYANTPQRVVTEINVRDEKETGILGIGKNYLTYHKIRKNNNFPHYKPVAEQFFKHLSQYKRYWKSLAVQKIALLYVDMVEIPEVEFDLDDYFHFGIKFPSDFGKVSQFETHFIFPPEYECGTWLDVQFRKVLLPNPENRSVFQIIWNYIKNVCDPDNVNEEVNEIHEFARDCFEKGLTDKCKELFNSKADQ